MLANLPVEIMLLICKYPELKDLGQLAWTNKRMMQIIKKHLPIALERKFLFYMPYKSRKIWEGRLCLFDSHTTSAENITKFTNCLLPGEVAVIKDKIFAIRSYKQSFEIFDLNTRRISRGPNPPEWRFAASVAYFKHKLYYLGGWEPGTSNRTNRVDVLIDGKWQTGPAFPFPISWAQTITCDEILYAIGGCEWRIQKIYRLSDDEWEWIEVGEIPKTQGHFGVASLNGRIYITGGTNSGSNKLESCLCFNPSAPVDSRISRIADMNYERYFHSLVATNGKLYAIGGYQKRLFLLSWLLSWLMSPIYFCNSIEEYDPQTNKWREVEEINIK